MADKEQSEGVKPSFREAVARHAPQVVREELPTIQMDDNPTGGKPNPFINDPTPEELEDQIGFWSYGLSPRKNGRAFVMLIKFNCMKHYFLS